MPSRTDGTGRAWLERALRTAGCLAVAGLFVRAWTGAGDTTARAGVRTSALDTALATWTVAPPQRVVLDATPVPSMRARDWLRALRRTGTPVAWRSASSSGSAMVVEPVALGSPRVTLATAAPSRVPVSDQLGLVDTISVTAAGATAWQERPVGSLAAAATGATPRAAPRDSLRLRPVLVLGQAGWEAKFVVAALEEAGWSVATRLSVAPRVAVTQGAAMRLDTATLGAVVVLDSTAVIDGPSAARFVESGGGLVASGTGVAHPSVRALLPGRAATVDHGTSGALMGPRPRDGLRARTLGNARHASLVIERRGGAPVVMARRIGAGRVVALGYEDTWRLRMVPPADSAPDLHRAWWSAVVASVTNAPPVPIEVEAPVDEAPYAAMVDALGPPGADAGAPGTRFAWDAVLAAVALLGLLGEWASRRSRGAT